MDKRLIQIFQSYLAGNKERVRQLIDEYGTKDFFIDSHTMMNGIIAVFEAQKDKDNDKKQL